MPYPLSINKLMTLACQSALCCCVLFLGVGSVGFALAEEAQPPATTQAPTNNDANEMDDLPLAQCLPQQRAIQAINQRPLAIRWLFLPYRGQLEVKHRRCLKQQSLQDQAQLQALPGPAAASVKPRKPAKPAKKTTTATKSSWFKWPFKPK
jgi:hypothetical protein